MLENSLDSRTGTEVMEVSGNDARRDIERGKRWQRIPSSLFFAPWSLVIGSWIPGATREDREDRGETVIHGEGAGPCWLAGAFEPFEAVAHVAKGRRDSEERGGGDAGREGGRWTWSGERERERDTVCFWSARSIAENSFLSLLLPFPPFSSLRHLSLSFSFDKIRRPCRAAVIQLSLFHPPRLPLTAIRELPGVSRIHRKCNHADMNRRGKSVQWVIFMHCSWKRGFGELARSSSPNPPAFYRFYIMFFCFRGVGLDLLVS